VNFSTDSKTNRIFEIECLRGFAALYVVLFHVLRPELQEYSYILSIPFRFGQEAVILFFLLSGFSINYSWSKRQEKSFPIFARDRLVRIMPIFLVALLITYVCTALAAQDWVDMDLGTLIGNALMLQDRPRPGTIVEPYMGNQALWSLSYEVAFYLFYYVLVRFTPPAHRTFVVGITSVVFFLVMLVYPNQLSRFLAYFCIWWLGAVMSEIHLGRVRAKEFFLALLPVGFVALCLAVLAANTSVPIDIGASVLFPYLELRHFAGALVIALAMFGWSLIGWKGFRLLFAPFALLAPVSYAVYVLHFPIMADMRESLELSPWLTIPATALVTLLFALALEGPFQRAINRAVKARRQKISLSTESHQTP
jgi:peptidoglycan/LPS O-acetylase OafA/YrhL